MRARAVVESGDWASMRGQSDFVNIDELFAVGMSSVRLGEPARAVAALEHLEKAAASIPDPSARAVADIMADQLAGLVEIAHGRSAGRVGGPGARRRCRGEAASAHRAAVSDQAGRRAVRRGAARDRRSRRRPFNSSRRALDRTPRRAAGLLGLARAAQKAGHDRRSPRARQRNCSTSGSARTRGAPRSPKCARSRRCAEVALTHSLQAGPYLKDQPVSSPGTIVARRSSEFV